jgi:hypothetical protein
MAPELLDARNTSSSSIHLEWSAIPDEYHRGTLLGYRVYYRPAETSRKEQVLEIDDPNVLHCDLVGLFLWWWYDIRIAGYTTIGSGVTFNASVQTDEHSKFSKFKFV